MELSSAVAIISPRAEIVVHAVKLYRPSSCGCSLHACTPNEGGQQLDRLLSVLSDRIIIVEIVVKHFYGSCATPSSQRTNKLLKGIACQ